MRLKLISRSVIGAMFAMAAGSACAQTSVTLYGVADTFFQYLNNGGSASVSQRSGGSTGSMFGLKGSEDLGGGLKANFVLESGYNINNGSAFADTTTLFYRQAWVGVAHADYGSLTFGRQYQPSFRAVYPTDPFRANEVLSPLSAAVLATDRNTLSTQYAAGRTSNAILYVSPKLAGFQLNAMYGFAATVTQPVPATTGNILDVSATYTGYGLFVGLAYMNEHSGVETVPSLPSALTLVGTEHYTAALAYRIGIVNLQANYSYASPKTPAAHSLAALIGSAHPYNITEVGASIQASSFDSFQIAGIQRNIHGINDETFGVELGYEHQVSKRTSLYARAGYLKNHGEATMSWPGVSVTAPHTSQTLAVVGMSHLF
ncbi:putative porin [Paraburkholderia unamae]|uniref:Porin n=1 Tax=Paraburkholderia unamae TaxID=219649 RepID=A0ABX5K9W8_9BURK|nr:putative porin [Paraburkholderia unamae]CAG9274330.1 Outer membrane protein (Porin) [Paraburkholderia unamae]